MTGRDTLIETLIETLIAEQGTLYSAEAGSDLARDTPEEVFHWLIGAILLSARISSALALRTAAALRAERLHTVDGIAAAAREDLVRVLNENGYARYDESTADYLRATAAWARESCGGDLRRLGADGATAGTVLKRLQGAKGLGPAGARIFAREAQLVWDLFYPTLDGKALEQARAYGLPAEADALAEAAGGRARFVRLVAALTRVALDGPSAAVAEAAGT